MINSFYPSFKGIRTTENGTPYHKSNAGTITGGIIAAAVTPMAFLGLNTLPSKIKKSARPILIAGSAYSLAAYIGCGAIVDHIRNKNSKIAAEQLREFGVENAMRINPNIRFTDANTPYYKSNNGGTNGALLGLAVGITDILFNFFANKYAQKNYPPKLKEFIKKQKQFNSNKIVNALQILMLSTLGGWILGKTTEHFGNKSAKNASIKQAYSQINP